MKFPALSRRFFYTLLFAAISVAVMLSPKPASAWTLSSAMLHYGVDHLMYEAAHHYDHRNYSSGYSSNPKDQGPVHPLSQALPNPRLTPGAIDPRVTQANLDQTICRRGGYTRSVRPPESYTEALKRRQIREYDYKSLNIWQYREDHLVPLEVGGAPRNPHNLWPEPVRTVGNWGSTTKNALENRIHDLVCERRISLAAGQHAFEGNWIKAFKRYIGPKPSDGRCYQYHAHCGL